MSASASQIEREVEASRANVEDTVEALKDKMSVGQMIDEAARYFGNSGSSDIMSKMGANLGAQIRDNPLPLALIGIGVAWLVSGRGTPHIRSRSRRHDYRYDMDDRDYGFGDDDFDYQRDRIGATGVYAGSSHPDYAGPSAGAESWSDTEKQTSGSSITSRAGEALHEIAETASGIASGVAGAASSVASAASRAGHAAYSAAGAVAEGARAVAGGARSGTDAAWRGGSRAYRGASRFGSHAYEGASRFGSGAYEGASWAGSGAYRGASRFGSQARHAFSDVLEREPLVLAGVGLALGAAMGAALPRTDLEDRYMGDTRDRLRDEAEEFAREKYEQGKAVASEAYHTAKQEAEAQGLTTLDDDSIVGRVGQVARATIERAKEKAEEEGLTSTDTEASTSTETASVASTGLGFGDEPTTKKRMGGVSKDRTKTV